MQQELKGDLINLIQKVNIISDKLAYFKSNHEDFNYKLKLSIGKESKLWLYTEKMNS